MDAEYSLLRRMGFNEAMFATMVSREELVVGLPPGRRRSGHTDLTADLGWVRVVKEFGFLEVSQGQVATALDDIAGAGRGIVRNLAQHSGPYTEVGGPI